MTPHVRLPAEGRLRGRSIFLSASVPHPKRDLRYQAVPHAQLEIEQAVVSLARAVFAEGGRLVFGGHPSISPLVSLVAGEYMRPVLVEGALVERDISLSPVAIHQLEAYADQLVEATRHMETLGQAKVFWHPVDPSERFETRQEERPSYPQSLKNMRLRMIADSIITGMVCIGGMEGVVEEAAMFAENRPSQPIFALARTGGAAALMANRTWDSRGRIPMVQIVDEEVMGQVADMLEEHQAEKHVPRPKYVPYPIIMQEIVRRVGDLRDETNPGLNTY